MVALFKPIQRMLAVHIGVLQQVLALQVHITVSGQLPRRTIPHRTGFGPDEWFYSVVVVLVGSCPGGE